MPTVYITVNFTIKTFAATTHDEVREAAKKKYFVSGLATKAFSPPPPRLSGRRN